MPKAKRKRISRKKNAILTVKGKNRSTKGFEDIFEPLAQAARSDRLLLFIGAGMSKCYDLPDWDELAADLKIKDWNYANLPDKFSEYVKSHGEAAFNDFLEAKLGRNPAVVYSSTMTLLEMLCVGIVTTNCDRVIESVADTLKVPVKVFVNDVDLEVFTTTPWLKLIKLHGTLDERESLVFTREQYNEHPNRVPGMRLKVAELIRDCNVLFLGYSMTDPDFYNIMNIVGSSKFGNVRQMTGVFSRSEIGNTWRRLCLDTKVKTHAPLLEIAWDDFGKTAQEGVTNFLKEFRERIAPRRLPSLRKQSVIFTNGYTATLKTELTTYLSDCLGIPLFATHRYGRCTSKNGILNPKKRHKRYSQLLAVAGQAIRKGESVILDGTFADKKWRKEVYRHARDAKAQVIVIKTECNDGNYIRARLWRRRCDHGRSEHEVTNFRNYEITREAIMSNPIESDEEFSQLGINVIRFQNNGDRKVDYLGTAWPDTKMIAELIKISRLMSTHI